MFNPAFIALLEESVGKEYAQTVLDALRGEASASIRLNPSKLRECPFPGAEKVPWSPFGYILKERPNFTLDPLFHAGCYYVQESSAMMVGEVFRRAMEGFDGAPSVLDLCAAPGGKTTDLAASLRESFGDGFTLLANEVIHSRFAILSDNVAAWGEPRVGVVSRDPSAFGKDPLFDIVLADVPCSGEGMFRKDARALSEWNADLPAFCASRSRRILADIWPTLREGGTLIYSTCTFNHVENDDTVSLAASELGASVVDFGPMGPALRTECGYLMLPGLVPGEGQYVAVLRKNGSGERCGDPFLIFKASRPAVSYDGPFWDVSRQDALKYLHGDALRLPAEAPSGFITISYCGHPLGPAKNIGTRCNNLYPKNRRIRMDV